MNYFSNEELERILMLVSGELFYLESHDKKDTEEFLKLKRVKNKLLRLVCKKA